MLGKCQKCGCKWYLEEYFNAMGTKKKQAFFQYIKMEVFPYESLVDANEFVKKTGMGVATS